MFNLCIKLNIIVACIVFISTNSYCVSDFKMRLLIIFLLALATANASDDQQLWKSFKAEHGKSYKSSLEEDLRFKIFQNNLRQIEEHNKKFENGETTWEMGITQFSDLTDEEFSMNFGKPTTHTDISSSEIFYGYPEDDYPENFDWRGKIDTLANMRIQYYCAAYWAMNTLDAIESQVFLKYKRKVRLSEQELVDCGYPWGSWGCYGGANFQAANYIIDNGIYYQENYPYKRYQEVCKNQTMPKSDIKLKSYVTIQAHNEQAMKQSLVNVGPIAVMYFNYFGKNYKSGIVDISYAVNNNWDIGGLLVGYGVENNTEYWTVQAYFGPQWGEAGHFRIARNKNDMCGIAYKAIYPVIQ